MEIRQIITFQKVAELNSFTRAAEALGYSQSAVTVQIKALETEFDTRLFDRFGKNVTITAAGRQFLKHAENILNQLDYLRSDLGDGHLRTHTLHIGTLNSLCTCIVSDLLDDLYKKHPEYHVKITRESPSGLIDMMEHNEVDIIYILDALRSDVHWKKIIQKPEPVVFVCRPEDPLLHKKKIGLPDLLRETFYLTEANDNYRYALTQYMAFQNMEIDPFLEVGDTEVIIRMIRENGGLSFLPYFAVREHLERKEIAVLPLENFHLNMYHQVICHKEKWVTDEMLEFIRIVRAALA